MRASVLAFVGILVMLAGSGCASIVSGRNQDVHITSNPPGAHVESETGVSVTTPGEITLVRNKPHTLVARYGDAEPQQVELRSDLNGWVFGNILFGGIIGAVIDFASGASGKLTPDAVCFDFTEAGKAHMEKKMAYLESHPGLNTRVRFAIMHERPLNGMSAEVLVIALGEPDEIVPEKKYEKYVYEGRDPRYYYVKDGSIVRTVK
jgi:hypothetical protein